jgi:3-deoxy-D-manno-octulosonate 8-phosphate phosphatase (KDO 8-P phosphatase)
MDRTTMDPSLEARLRGIQLLLCDVDGILTDAAVFVGAAGEFKRFNILDGLGLALLRREGVKVGWISNRPSEATRLRAEELKVDFLHQQPGDKTEAARQMLAQTGLTPGQTCYMGDDIVDVGLLRMVGLAVSVPNGRPEAKAAAHYVTDAAGGDGAVREIVELILKAKNRWIPLMDDYARHGSR